MSMSEYDINAKVTYTDAGATATIGKVTQATTAQATATKAAGESATKAAVGVGQFGSTVGLAGQAVSRLSPALGGLVTMAGSSLGAIQSLTTAGMGPLGLAVAGVSLAVAAGTAIYNLYTENQETAADATRDTTEALDDHKRSIDDVIGSITSLNQQMALASRVALGAGSITEQVANSGVKMAELMEIEARIEARRAQGLVDTIADSRARTAAQNAYNEAIANETAARRINNEIILEGVEEDAPRPAGGGRRAGAVGPDAMALAAGDVEEKQRAFAEAMREQLRADEDARTELEQKAIDARAEMQRAAVDQAIDDEERRVEGVRRALNREMEARRESAQEFADIQAGVASASEVLQDAIIASAGSSEKAQKQAQQVAAGVAMSSAIVKGALEVAEAAASAAIGDIPGAVQHGIAAAAFAVAAGKAGAQMAGGGSSGGGSGGGGARTGGPAMSSGASDRGGDTIIVNLGSTALYAADRAQLGRDIDEMVSGSRARLGRTG